MGSIFLFGCQEEVYIPKPRAYIRIDFPEKQYKEWSGICPYRFEIPSEYAFYSAASKEYPCNIDIHYPYFKATLHCTYAKSENLWEFVEKSHDYAYNHHVKATAIDEHRIAIDPTDVYGVGFDIQGETACNYQFYFTDSVDQFFAGSLYFSVAPNPDSLSPALKFIKEDIQHMISTFSWENRN